MLFYLIGPFSVAGMSFKEPYIALGIAAGWGIYGAVYFVGASKKKAKSVLVPSGAQGRIAIMAWPQAGAGMSSTGLPAFAADRSIWAGRPQFQPGRNQLAPSKSKVASFSWVEGRKSAWALRGQVLSFQVTNLGRGQSVADVILTTAETCCPQSSTICWTCCAAGKLPAQYSSSGAHSLLVFTLDVLNHLTRMV
jgi:hypothetical protein